MSDCNRVTAKFDADAEVIEKLLRGTEFRVVIFHNSLGSYTAQARRLGESSRDVPDSRETDDFTPAKALARLAYKVVYRQIVTWEE